MASPADYNPQAADLHPGRHPCEADSNGSVTIKDDPDTYLEFQEERPRRGLIASAWLDDCLTHLQYREIVIPG